MKNLILFMFFIFCIDSFAGTCTSISRTNSSANQVLTSAKYNSDNNTAYAAINSIDLGCAASGSLDDSATLSSSAFAVPLSGIDMGCLIARSDANTISVDKCYLSINNAWVKTTAATTVTWGGSSDAEAASTRYYVYALATSTGSTLNLALKTTAPNNDGFDVSGNKALGSFYNDSASAIQSDVNQWVKNRFMGGTIEGVALLQDVKGSGSAGGTSGAGVWVTRTLNTLTGDTSFVSITANRFILVPGKYVAHANIPLGINTASNGSAIYNVTTASYEQYGQSRYMGTATTETPITVDAILEPAVATTYELRHFTTSAVTDGLGGTSGGGVPSASTVFSSVLLMKILP